ncbi:MAG: hypothetical protein FWC38_05840 [Proteobacteria bacterium]|nr:hypothetical protein [Pseudomonadota bacterium]MCL2307732.1 hypothetical protein [Pseudomonadota bacterium]
MKSLRRRLSSLFAVSARHNIAIRRARPRWLSFLLIAVVFFAGMAATWWTARYVFSPPSAPLTAEQASAQEREEALKRELADLQRSHAALESELSMREGSQATLAQHTEALEQENTQLREELTYLQKLVADATRQAGAKIQDVRLEPLANNTYRYRILLVQGGNPKNDFEGTVKLQVSADGAAQAVPLEVVPDRNAAGKVSDLAMPLPVKFKYYQRLEGVFRVPDGMKVQQFTVQVLKKGGSTPAITRSINVK